MKIKKLFILLFLCFIFTIMSCKKEANNITKNQNTQIDSIITPDTISNIENDFSIDINSLKETNNNYFEILLPSTYRIFGENPTKKLNKNWTELYTENGKFFLGNAKYSIKKGFDECAVVDNVTIDTNKNVFLLFEKNDWKLGKVNSINITNKHIFPKEKIELNYNGLEYYIRAEGDFITSDDVPYRNNSTKFDNIKNYKLFFSTKGSPEQLFLEQESFNDTTVEFLFIGDIDNDGKLDFIIEANRDYEEKHVVLYLSSLTKGKNIIEKVSEIFIQFDC